MRTLYVDGVAGLCEAIASFRSGTLTEAFEDSVLHLDEMALEPLPYKLDKGHGYWSAATVVPAPGGGVQKYAIELVSNASGNEWLVAFKPKGPRHRPDLASFDPTIGTAGLGRLMATVIAILGELLDRYPDAEVSWVPTDARRARIYTALAARHGLEVVQAGNEFVARRSQEVEVGAVAEAFEDSEPTGGGVAVPLPGGRRGRGRPAKPPAMWSPATVPELGPDAIATLTQAFEAAGFTDIGPPKSQYLDPKKCLVGVGDGAAGKRDTPEMAAQKTLALYADLGKEIPRVPGNAPTVKNFAYEAIAQGLTFDPKQLKGRGLKVRMKDNVHLAVALYIAPDDRVLGIAWADAKVVGNRPPAESMPDDELGAYLARYPMGANAQVELYKDANGDEKYRLLKGNKFEQWALEAFEILGKRHLDDVLFAVAGGEEIDDHVEELAQDVMLGAMKHARTYKPGTDFVKWVLATAGAEDPEWEHSIEFQGELEAPEAKTPKVIPPGNREMFNTYMSEYGPEDLFKMVRSSIQHGMNRGMAPDDLDDLAQQTMLKAQQQIHTYDPAQTEFASWLKIVASSVLHDWGRENKARKRREKAVAYTPEEVGYEADESLENQTMGQITFLEMVEALLEADLPFAGQRGRGARPYKVEPYAAVPSGTPGLAAGRTPTLAAAKPGFLDKLKNLGFVKAAFAGAEAPWGGAVGAGADVGFQNQYQAGYAAKRKEFGGGLGVPTKMTADMERDLKQASKAIERATSNYKTNRDALRKVFTKIPGLDPDTMRMDWTKVGADDQEKVFNSFSEHAIDAALPMVPGFMRQVAFLEQVMIGIESVAIDTLGIGSRELRTAESGLTDAQEGARQLYDAAQQIIQRPVEFSDWKDFTQAGQAVIEAIRMMFSGTERAIKAMMQAIDKSTRMLGRGAPAARRPRFTTVDEE